MGGMTLPVSNCLIRFAVLAGAADSDTAGIACADEAGNSIAIGDTIIACMELVVTDNTPTDRTAAAAIIAGGKITVPSSANDTIIVWWMAQTSEVDQMASPKVLSFLATGAGAASDITCTGINVGDTIACALEIATTTGAVTDQTSDMTVTAANTVRCANDTTNDWLFILWHSLTNVQANANQCIKFALCTAGTSAGSDITCTGIKVGDEVIACLIMDGTSALPVENIPNGVTILSDDTIEISATSPTDASGDDIWVFWNSRQAGSPA